MKLKILLFTLVLWSCGLARGLSSAFVKVEKSSFNIVDGKPFDISDRMPRYRSDGNLGLCFGFSATACAQHYICEQKNISDCKQLKPSEEISPFSGVSWANTNSDSGGVPDIMNHMNIKFAGGGSSSMKNAAYSSFIFQAESCYPFDQFGNKYKKNPEVLNAILNKYESQFKKNKTEGTALCEECLQKEIFKDFSVSITADELKNSLGKESFGEFLYAVFFRNCADLVKFKPRPKFNMYPGNQSTDYKGIIEKIKEVLDKGAPLNFDGICPEFVSEKKGGRTVEVCSKDKNGNPMVHSLAITGYEKRCKANTNPLVCKELLRVHNSWGKDWQDAYDGGWVDAETMINAAKIGRTDYGSDVLSWYTNPKKEAL